MTWRRTGRILVASFLLAGVAWGLLNRDHFHAGAIEGWVRGFGALGLFGAISSPGEDLGRMTVPA